LECPRRELEFSAPFPWLGEERRAKKASQFTDEDGVPVAEICRKAGISQATYFDWKKKWAGAVSPMIYGALADAAGTNWAIIGTAVAALMTIPLTSVLAPHFVTDDGHVSCS
jgi:hypothetical protein